MTSDIPPGFRFFKAIIADVAAQHRLDPAVVAAVVWQESAFNTDGFRHERDFWNRYMKTRPEYREMNPRRASSSYGLMQCMWPVALERGMDKTLPPEALFVPALGLEMGCRQLAYLRDRVAKIPVSDDMKTQAMLASYNGGQGGNQWSRADDGSLVPLRNGKYAREVLARVPIMRREYERT